MHKLVAFELRVIQELLFAASDGAHEHSLAVSHLVLAIRALVLKQFRAVFDLTDEFALSPLSA
jgi:hypothetical protein